MSPDRPGLTRWLLLGLGTTFVGCFALLTYCDLWRPEAPGLHIDLSAAGLEVIAVMPETPADRAGLRAGDTVRTWQGRDTRDLDLMIIEGNVELGQPLVLTVDRGGTTFETTMVQQRAPWSYWLSREGWMLLAARAVQLTSLVLAFVVLLRGRPELMTYLGAWMLATFSVFVVVPPYRLAAVWRDLPGVVGVLLWFPYTSGLAITAVLATFLAVFPRRTRRQGITWIAIWIPMGMALVLPTVYLLRLVYAPDSVRARSFGATPLIATNAGYLIWGTAKLAQTYRRLEDISERRRVRVLAGGMVGGCVGALWVIPGYWTSPIGELGESLFQSPWLAAGTLLLLAVPLAFAYAILRLRLFDLRLIVRQGVRYALARRAILWLVPAFIVVIAADLLLRHQRDDLVAVLRTHAVGYAVTGGLIVMTRWRRSRWLEAIDRRFFRDRYDGQRLLRRVAEALHDAGSIEGVAPRLSGQLESAFHAEFAAVLICREGDSEYSVLASSPHARAPRALPATSTFAGLLGLLGRPVQVGLPEVGWLSRQLPPAEVEMLRENRLELVVPVAAFGNTPQVLLALGPKRSEEPYTDDDSELVGAIARNLALLLTRPRATSTPAPSFEECPVCGTCYDTGTTRCPDDNAALEVTHTPQVIAGRYRLRHRLGEGGMGTVYAAQDEALDRDVAVKLIRPAMAARSQTTDRFQREARTAASLAHPNVVTVHDFGETDGGPYLVMEKLEGRTLRAIMRETPSLGPDRIIEILRGVCAALAAAHRRQLVHRDLKPENIFLAASGDDTVVKVLDFGLAKYFAATTTPTEVTTTPGVLIGTPQYMAPEQFAGGEVGPACDIWALGVMTFEMLCGVHPVGDSIASARHLFRELPWLDETIAMVDLSDSSQAFFRRALAKDPADRPPDPAAFLSDLERALAEHRPPAKLRL